jgi:hypothetical protein
LNLYEAITLLVTVSDFHFSPPDKRPDFHILENLNEEYVLLANANLVNEEYRNYLKEVAVIYGLEIEESKGFLIIYDPTGQYSFGE